MPFLLPSFPSCPTNCVKALKAFKALKAYDKSVMVINCELQTTGKCAPIDMFVINADVN